MVTVETRGDRYRVLQDGDALRWSAFRQALENDPATRAALTKVLQDAPHPAYFWECVPWPVGEDPLLEFVLLSAPGLARRRANADAFTAHLDRGSGLTRTFPSLRGDAELVVPTKEGDEREFGHLASWIRYAAPSQIEAMWISLARAIWTWRLEDRGTLWVSTSGGGVPWLHLRLDSRPKYYKYVDFKR
ncbi:MAG: hypothetical protein AAGE52_41235 [Myxococcota bacterium]